MRFKSEDILAVATDLVRSRERMRELGGDVSNNEVQHTSTETMKIDGRFAFVEVSVKVEMLDEERDGLSKQ